MLLQSVQKSVRCCSLEPFVAHLSAQVMEILPEKHGFFLDLLA